LLAFASRQRLVPQVIDLNTTIAELFTMLRRLIGAGVELQFVPAASHCTVRVDPAQFEQVLVNLVVNARDALAGSGAITLMTSFVTIEPEAARRLGLAAGPYLQLTVADNGPGMSEQVRQRLFEPFFTTKPTGAGSGLGLATSYGIVRQSGGQIDVLTTPGAGTQFQIYLPYIEQQAAVEALAPRSERPSVGTESLLLVEDEEHVRAVAARALRARGYQVTVAANGAEALDLLGTATDAPPALMITDVVMPGLNGYDLARVVRARYPQIRVLFVSGYNELDLGTEPDTDRNATLLAKPFSTEDLTRRVRTLLDAPH
jgi:two-component system, cell cycle sensor histidine kinase and response regulator CckA